MYLKESNKLATIKTIDWTDNSITVIQGGKEFKLDLEENGNTYITLEALVKLNSGLSIYQDDIVKDKAGYKYIIEQELHDSVRATAVDDNYNKLERTAVFKNDNPNLLNLDIVDSVHILRKNDEVDVDFNIKVVAMGSDIFYACNNKETDVVDLIKVIFIGADLSYDEEYTRISIGHDDYKIMVKTKEIEDRTPTDAYNYVMDKKRNPSKITVSGNGDIKIQADNVKVHNEPDTLDGQMNIDTFLKYDSPCGCGEVCCKSELDYGKYCEQDEVGQEIDQEIQEELDEQLDAETTIKETKAVPATKAIVTARPASFADCSKCNKDISKCECKLFSNL